MNEQLESESVQVRDANGETYWVKVVSKADPEAAEMFKGLIALLNDRLEE